ncbi:Fe-S cluster assembly protein SufD [Paenibacillus graminis]|uniref:Fe-S cluster assembly protein SufD n=1 Tax=Paenibacillus graminis TaxID=189425 RepID=UPI002DB7CBC8|nr:Fe-S cluster assembly protein SufD [Paenibacillus graminis]MEC0166971.1 Fe-S cluster assembly protein SufD [Paenibacillus graminis]
MDVLNKVSVDADDLCAWSKAKAEPQWLLEQRLQALKQAEDLELPEVEKIKLEHWDIHEHGVYKAEKMWPDLQEAHEAVHSLVNFPVEGGLIVQHNSDVVYTELSADLAAQGVILTDLHTAAREHGELVQRYLGQAVKPEEHRLSAVHSAVWSGGVFLYIPDGVEVEVPLQAIFFSSMSGARFAPHILIVAGNNSKISYVDNCISGSEDIKVLHNGVMEVFAGSGSKVQVASVHQLAAATTDFTERRAVVLADGAVEWITGEMNNGYTATDTKTLLQGNGSSSDAKVIAVGSGYQKLSYTTQAQHFGRSSVSRMITRAVMREEATAIINGITKIEKGATHCDGQQTERILMLSPKARGDANPILLIDEDDVTAGHAASVGQVNAEQIYYLMSRGISRNEAEYLVIFGFLAPVISEIPLEGVRSRLQDLVERKLGRSQEFKS